MKVVDYSGNHLYKDHLCLAPRCGLRHLEPLQEGCGARGIHENGQHGLGWLAKSASHLDEEGRICTLRAIVMVSTPVLGSRMRAHDILRAMNV